MDSEQIVPMHLTVTPKRIAVKLFVVWEQNMLFSNTISLQIRELSKRKVDYVCPFFLYANRSGRIHFFNGMLRITTE